MNNDRLKKIFIGILVAILLLLGALSVFIASRLQQQNPGTNGNFNISLDGVLCTTQTECSSDSWSSCTACGEGSLGCCQVSQNSNQSFAQNSLNSSLNNTQKTNGSSCSANSECTSLNCMQGVCAEAGVTLDQNSCAYVNSQDTETCKPVAAWGRNTLPELIEEAMQSPGEIIMSTCNAGSAGVGSISIGSELGTCNCENILAEYDNLEAGQCYSGVCTPCNNPASICKAAAADVPPSSTPTSVKIEGQAYCQDAAAATYPIEGATIQLKRADGTTVEVTTDEDGKYLIEDTTGDGTGYSLDLTQLPDGSLSTGQPYSAMTALEASNCDSETLSCTGQSTNYCSSDNTAYNQCTLEKSNTSYQNFDFKYASCTGVGSNADSSTNQCIELAENGSDPSANGAGNFIEYSLVYQHDSATNPYPNIKLRVGTSAAPVGRDAITTSSSLVSPFNVTYDSVLKRYTYRFRWEAVNPAGTVPVPAGTYNVRALLDGTTEVNQPSDCLESITLSDTATEEPLFSIIKQSSVVCETSGDNVVNYTVNVSNVGNVSGTMDFLADTYDSQVNTLGIAPTNLNPATGNVNGGKIRWTGDASQRTFTAKQSREYKYSIRIPKNSVSSFTQNGLLNQANVQYDTASSVDNSASFDLRTMLNCSSPTTTIPNTFIGGNLRFVILGLILIIAGLVVYKKRLGARVAGDVISGITDRVKASDIRMPFETYEDSTLKNIERKSRKK
jgi:hypothetical protein